MIYSLKGRVLLTDGDTVVVDVHDVGYQVLVSHVNDYEVGQDVFLYTYNVVREDETYLVGFSSLEEKEVFLALISAIASNNVVYLKKLPGIGAKAASQIILDLKGELTGTKGDPTVYDEVAEALKELGFKGAAIERVLATINEKDASPEEVLRLALAKLRK